MTKIGLVLSGGGGKGAYEIGVLRFLLENGIEKNICAVSGTSVGALNAAIYACENYEKAVRMWKSIRQDQILSKREVSHRDILNWLAKVGITHATPQIIALLITMLAGFTGVALTMAPSLALALPVIASTRASIVNISRIADNTYLFTREGLLQMIDEGVNFEKLRGLSMPCFVTCLAVSKNIGSLSVKPLQKGIDIPWASVKRFDLRLYSDEEIKKLLLASSAIPVVFDAVEFQGRYYFDGGIPQVGDNTPISPIYKNAKELGIDRIIVVRLSSKKRNYHNYPKDVVIEVKPDESLGNKLTGTLNFSSEYAEELIDIGYNDAKKQLAPRLREIT